MTRHPDIDNKLFEARQKAGIQRLAMIATTVIIVICSIVVVVKKQRVRAFEAQQIEQQIQAEQEARWQQQHMEATKRRAAEHRVRELANSRQRDSVAASPRVDEPQPYIPKYKWDDLETMVRSLSNEDYYASVWCVEMNTPKWVVLYSKGGKTYFRHFNPEKKTYGAKVRLIQEGVGKYHASGNKRDRYYYGNGGTLVHEVNGVHKETFVNHRIINLFTPEPAPDGYDDWEDYYYDNEEDFREYYGR